MSRSLTHSLTHLHDLLRAGPDGLESPERVSEGEARLGLRPALHQLHRAGNQADLAGEVHRTVHLKCGKWVIYVIYMCVNSNCITLNMAYKSHRESRD